MTPDAAPAPPPGTSRSSKRRIARRCTPRADRRAWTSIALMLALALPGCSQRAPTPEPRHPPAPRTIVADYALRALGGTLLGTDRGEWIGELWFRDEAGGLQRLLRENVQGIVENRAGVFVLTGLRHGRVNDGFVYTIALTENRDVVATRLGRLPGSPSDVTRHADGTTTFLVARERPGPDGGTLDECDALAGRVVRRASGCGPPARPMAGAGSSVEHGGIGSGHAGDARPLATRSADPSPRRTAPAPASDGRSDPRAPLPRHGDGTTAESTAELTAILPITARG